MHPYQEQSKKKYYLKLAQQAAELERDHQYENAAMMWKQVSYLASHPENKLWAENRHDFCLRYRPIMSLIRRGRPRNLDTLR
ncbi:ANR family transcriptional regulator [Vibrio maritimus]|uniref:ANR family transcriptional regulator n=1 Tax=Vibrio maritimus TaxID=990268 RepID=UPI001F223404|nr:ANR family transcriptional regulator [Vibrio maritimus]